MKRSCLGVESSSVLRQALICTTLNARSSTTWAPAVRSVKDGEKDREDGLLTSVPGWFLGFASMTCVF